MHDFTYMNYKKKIHEAEYIKGYQWQRERRMRSDYLMGAKFLFGVMKMFWKYTAITQYCKYKQCH